MHHHHVYRKPVHDVRENRGIIVNTETNTEEDEIEEEKEGNDKLMYHGVC